MSDRQQSINGKQSSPCTAAGRVIAFIVVAFAVCMLVKKFVCGRICENCPCQNDDESNDCTNQAEPVESAQGNAKN